MSVYMREGVTVPPLRTASLGLCWPLLSCSQGGRKSEKCALHCGLCRHCREKVTAFRDRPVWFHVLVSSFIAVGS